MALRFDTDFEVPYGVVEQLSPLVRRVVADNPGPFTFKGTATFLVGRGELAVIDPGPDLDSHFEALAAAVEGEQVTHIVVTHTHGDHSPGARRLAELTGAPIVGCGPHPTTGSEELSPDDDPDETDVDAAAPDGEAGATPTDPHAKGEPWDSTHQPDQLLTHGMTVSGPGWSLEAVHTPGHLANHLCFALAEESTLFSGDHVMGWSTSVISPPGGDLADYLESLELVAARGDALYRPTHGPAIEQPLELVRGLIAHRRDREAQIVSRLEAGDERIRDIVAALYDVVPALRKAAGRSVLSHLLALRRAGRVECEGLPGVTTRWWLT